MKRETFELISEIRRMCPMRPFIGWNRFFLGCGRFKRVRRTSKLLAKTQSVKSVGLSKYGRLLLKGFLKRAKINCCLEIKLFDEKYVSQKRGEMLQVLIGNCFIHVTSWLCASQKYVAEITVANTWGRFHESILPAIEDDIAIAIADNLYKAEVPRARNLNLQIREILRE